MLLDMFTSMSLRYLPIAAQGRKRNTKMAPGSLLLVNGEKDKNRKQDRKNDLVRM